MKIDKNKVVALSYELTVDGAIADKAGADRPLEYIHGTGMLLPRFEEEVEGKEVGEDFAFTLSPEEGYGVYTDDAIFELPLEAFQIDGQIREDLLQIGRVIPMMNDAGGIVQGTVKEVRAESVLMDFNHPMAGKTLNFKGSVVAVRDASEEELANGLQRHCGCHKGEGGEGCEGGCNCHEGEGCGCEGGEGECKCESSEGCGCEGGCNC